MKLPPPPDRQTRLHGTPTYTAAAHATTDTHPPPPPPPPRDPKIYPPPPNVTIDPNRRAERQGFKLVQASSMFINEGGSCGAYTDCHDSNATRFIGSDQVR